MSPGEVESLGGDRTVSMLTPSVVVTDRYQEQSLEGAAGKVGVVGVLHNRRTSLIPRGHRAVTSCRGLVAGKTPGKRISYAALE